MQAVVFRRVDGLERAHPEWVGYDLITHVLGALHLIIEGDRLAGGQTPGAGDRRAHASA